jgi:hypothetical protein
MNKTRASDIYLKKASALLQACKSAGIWAKVNVLLYAGETASTLQETLDWLDVHRECIKGVSVNPLVVYGASAESDEYLDSLRTLGAVPIDETDLAHNGYASLHLSRSIDYETAQHLSIDISKRYMRKIDYFDLKSFSYFSRRLTYEAFQRVIADCPDRDLPFTP